MDFECKPCKGRLRSCTDAKPKLENIIGGQHAPEYPFYLRSVCKISLVSAAKYIKNLKKIVNSCIAHGWIPKNPFANYKSKAKAGDRVYLSQEELFAIYQNKFAIERLEQVKDIFLFCCKIIKNFSRLLIIGISTIADFEYKSQVLKIIFMDRNA